VKIVYEMVKEKDKRLLHKLNREFDYNAALTRNIVNSPITLGVNSLWYPLMASLKEKDYSVESRRKLLTNLNHL